MKDYTELVKALRECGERAFCNDCPIFDTCDGDIDRAMHDAAAAIEALQAEVERLEPKHGEWILCGPVGWPNWRCSVCHSEGRGDYIRCPWCGAVMDESNASNTLNALDNAQDGPIITPCRGCSDYDGYGGCKSKGGCARAKMEVQDESAGSL